MHKDTSSNYKACSLLETVTSTSDPEIRLQLFHRDIIPLYSEQMIMINSESDHT